MSAAKAIASQRRENRSLSAPVRGEVEAQLESLKQQLLRPILERVSNGALAKEILWAANEAAALAWCTVCPALILPVLLEEKVRDAFAKWERQQRVRSDLFKRQPRLDLSRVFLRAAHARNVGCCSLVA